jgi:hypothetical protein
MANPEKFYLVLVGDDDKQSFSPGKMRGKELGEFLSLLDEMFSAVLNSQLGDDFGGLRVVGVSKGSLSIACQPVRAQIPVFADLTNQIESGCLTKKVQPPVEKIRIFNTGWNTRLEFRKTKKGPSVATIHKLPQSPEVCAMSCVSMQTSTTLYGQITSISGVNKINVGISLLGFPGSIRFEVRKKDDIKKFCARFGQIVGVSGTAEVRLPSREITHFAFKDFSPYQETPLPEGIEKLRKSIGDHFNVPDIEEIIREHRGDA